APSGDVADDRYRDRLGAPRGRRRHGSRRRRRSRARPGRGPRRRSGARRSRRRGGPGGRPGGPGGGGGGRGVRRGRGGGWGRGGGCGEWGRHNEGVEHPGEGGGPATPARAGGAPPRRHGPRSTAVDPRAYGPTEEVLGISDLVTRFDAHDPRQIDQNAGSSG